MLLISVFSMCSLCFLDFFIRVFRVFLFTIALVLFSSESFQSSCEAAVSSSEREDAVECLT